MKPSSKELLIGAHTSAAGGAYNALFEGKVIGATTIQLFTSNQKRWEGRDIGEEEVALWEKALEETGIRQVMSHDSYLINLGSPNPDGLQKSRQAFKEELLRCHRLKIDYLNFHPGAALDSSVEQSLDQIVNSLLQLEKLAAEGPTRLILETSAGQGSTIGHRFEHLAYIIDKVHTKVPIGVCIDTCHIFAAGYDIRTKEAWDATLQEFENVVGLQHLYAFHLNDSIHPLGSRKDRHAPLGEGAIGLECFKYMMTHPNLRELPKYLETPDGPTLWQKEIHLLRDFADEKN